MSNTQLIYVTTPSFPSGCLTGGGTAAVIALLAVLHRRPTPPTRLYYTTRHVAPIIVFLFACIFAWRAHLLVNSGQKQYLLLLLVVMSVGSIYVFVSLLISHAADNDRVRLAAEAKKK